MKTVLDCDALAKMQTFSFFTPSDAALSRLQFVNPHVEMKFFSGSYLGGEVGASSPKSRSYRAKRIMPE